MSVTVKVLINFSCRFCMYIYVLSPKKYRMLSSCAFIISLSPQAKDFARPPCCCFKIYKNLPQHKLRISNTSVRKISLHCSKNSFNIRSSHGLLIGAAGGRKLQAVLQRWVPQWHAVHTKLQKIRQLGQTSTEGKRAVRAQA